MKPDDGVTLNAEIDVLGVDAGATGPGSGATPDRVGEVRTMGVVAVATGATTFFTTVVLVLCLWTVAELALAPIMIVEQTNATEVKPTDINLTLRLLKRLFILIPSVATLIFDIKLTRPS
jgi:flagellar biosynthesis protein FlhB